MSLILVNWQLRCNLHDWGGDAGWGLLGMGVGALGCVRIYFPLAPWFIRRGKFACGNGSKARCSWQEWLTTELLPATHTLLCFHSGYFCFMYGKKASRNTYQGGGGEGKPNLLWLDGRIWCNKCGWLSPFSLSISNIRWFVAWGAYPLCKRYLGLRSRSPSNSTSKNIICK